MTTHAAPKRDDEPTHVEPMKRRSLFAGQEWDDAMRIAAERGDNVSEIVRATLRRYVKRHS